MEFLELWGRLCVRLSFEGAFNYYFFVCLMIGKSFTLIDFGVLFCFVFDFW